MSYFKYIGMVQPEIEILKILREWENVDIILKKDIDEYVMLTYRLPYAKSGETITVPLWVAKVLIDDDIAFVDIEKLNEWINRVYWREKVQRKGLYNISKITKDFYVKTSLICFLIDKLHKIGDYENLELLRKGLEKLREVINKRKNAIPVLSEIEDLTIMDRLTEEEKILLGIFKEIIYFWRSYTGV